MANVERIPGRNDHCTHPTQSWCDCDWCRLHGHWHATMKRGAEGWDVYYAGHVVLTNETYQIASNVQHSLNHGGTGFTECDEVARVILSREGA